MNKSHWAITHLNTQTGLDPWLEHNQAQRSILSHFESDLLIRLLADFGDCMAIVVCSWATALLGIVPMPFWTHGDGAHMGEGRVVHIWVKACSTLEWDTSSWEGPMWAFVGQYLAQKHFSILPYYRNTTMFHVLFAVVSNQKHSTSYVSFLFTLLDKLLFSN